MPQFKGTLSLFDEDGSRKYINSNEREGLLNASLRSDPTLCCFFLMLIYTGARISETLGIKAEQLDLRGLRVTLRTLKRRQKGLYRSIPLPEQYVQFLTDTYQLGLPGSKLDNPLWTMSRSTASRKIRALMKTTNIIGKQASAKGLRHGFAIHALSKGVPVSQVSSWLGHASLETTMIYVQYSKLHEREQAMKMWKA